MDEKDLHKGYTHYPRLGKRGIEEILKEEEIFQEEDPNKEEVILCLVEEGDLLQDYKTTLVHEEYP